MITIDVIVVNYRCLNETVQALSRLGGWALGRVWVVDNSEDAAEAAGLATLLAGMPWAKLLVSPCNLGFGRACNLAFAQSQAELVLLLNPDARTGLDDIDTLAGALRADSQLAAVAPVMYWNEEHTFVIPHTVAQTPLVALGALLRSRWRGLARRSALAALARMRAQLGEAGVLRVSFLTGAVLLLRRAAVVAAGGLFDPRYFMFFEDSELSLRLRRSGWGLGVVPTAQAVHTYRHKAFKAGLMGQARQQYFAACFPGFFRLTVGLARLDRLVRPVPLAKWFHTVPQALTSADSFAAATGGAKVLAWSPSLLMQPAIFRPDPALANSFSAAEWALLEPAAYVALLQAGGGAPQWWYFEVAPPSAPPAGAQGGAPEIQ
jgi:GT2 family glycosyltransferase